MKNARLKGDIVLNTALTTLAVENTELFTSPSAIEVCLSLSLSDENVGERERERERRRERRKETEKQREHPFSCRVWWQF